jgi:hypothetical protein
MSNAALTRYGLNDDRDEPTCGSENRCSNRVPSAATAFLWYI